MAGVDETKAEILKKGKDDAVDLLVRLFAIVICEIDFPIETHVFSVEIGRKKTLVDKGSFLLTIMCNKIYTGVEHLTIIYNSVYTSVEHLGKL